MVADAKCFRLSRTAKNQKDFKVSNLSDWRGSENEYAVLVAPYFQYPQSTSQIYSKALDNNVCLLAWEHISILLEENVKETELLSLESLWNASQMIARDKSLSFANAKCCFLPKMDVYVSKKIGLSESKYRSMLNDYKRLIMYRGKTEIAYWTGCIEEIKKYTKEKAIEGVRENRLEVPVGGEYRLTLSDGTRVWLNAASSLTYPEIFQDRERVVELTGEAFFEVKPDTALPFIVKTQGMRVKVLGTTFNVKAYPDELKLYTTLVEGKVEVFSDYLHRGVMLYPGEQAVSDSSEIQKRQVNVQPYISWKEGKFVFINAPLGEICKQIARWYDVEIQFADNEIGKVCFTGAILKFRPLEDLLDMIEVTSRVQYRREGKILLFWQNK